jgi:hypothetical protein
VVSIDGGPRAIFKQLPCKRSGTYTTVFSIKPTDGLIVARLCLLEALGKSPRRIQSLNFKPDRQFRSASNKYDTKI